MDKNVALSNTDRGGLRDDSSSVALGLARPKCIAENMKCVKKKGRVGHLRQGAQGGGGRQRASACEPEYECMICLCKW